MKRQGLNVSIDELRELADDLERQCRHLNLELNVTAFDYKHRFQINIINHEGLSDTWKIESDALHAVRETGGKN